MDEEVCPLVIAYVYIHHRFFVLNNHIFFRISFFVEHVIDHFLPLTYHSHH